MIRQLILPVAVFLIVAIEDRKIAEVLARDLEIFIRHRAPHRGVNVMGEMVCPRLSVSRMVTGIVDIHAALIPLSKCHVGWVKLIITM